MKHQEFRNRVSYARRNKELVAENEAMKQRIHCLVRDYNRLVKELRQLEDEHEDVVAQLEHTDANLKELHKGYTNVVHQLNEKEKLKDEDPSKQTQDEMQHLREHCDMLEKDKEQLKRQCVQLQIERNEAKTHAEQIDVIQAVLCRMLSRFEHSEFLEIGSVCTPQTSLSDGDPVKVGSEVCTRCRHLVKMDVSGKKCVLCAYCYDNKKAEEAQECKHTDKKD